MIYEIEAEHTIKGSETCYFIIEANSEEEALQKLKNDKNPIPTETWEDYIEATSDLYNIKIVDEYEK